MPNPLHKSISSFASETTLCYTLRPSFSTKFAKMKLIHRPHDPSKYGRIPHVLKISLPFVSFIAMTLFTALFFGLGTSTALLAGYMDAVCSANGDFHLYTGGGYTSAGFGTRYNPYWQGSQFLSITLGFGRFPYALAKAIDVCWDLIVGRGGQLLLTFLAYPVIRRSLFLYMEQTPVNVPLYISVAFEKVSLLTLRAISRDLSRQLEQTANAAPSPPRLRYSGFCFIIGYILVFPTIFSVMTGYQANWIPYIERPDNHALVRFSDLETPLLIVMDGERVGLTNEHPVFEGDQDFNTLLACT